MSQLVTHTWQAKDSALRCVFTRLGMSAASGQGSEPVNYQPTIKLDMSGDCFQEGSGD